MEQLKAERARLQRQLEGYAPRQPYLVVDTAGNRVYLRRGETTLSEMLASCGSGNILNDPNGERKWVFDTPRGEFVIRSKTLDPVWVKPDWAYIEAGEPIPAKRSERLERGALGSHALGLGEGYFIHGTLLTRTLGRNGSHGCIRLGDADLKALYEQVPVGTRVVIY